MPTIPLPARLERLRAALPEFSGALAPLWIDGRWRPSATGASLPCFDPTIGAPLVDVATAAPEDLEVAVAAAQRAQAEWWRADGQDRARVLRRIADGIRAHAQALGTLDTLDAGRPIRDTATRDTDRAARLFEFFAGTTDRLRGAVVPVQPGRTNLIEYEPIGVVGAITPWNYPLTNAASKVAPALATGNAVILKPAEESPLSALLLGWIAHQAGLPAGLLNILNGTGEIVGDAIVRHPEIGKIAFTGSTAVGRQIARIGGEFLKSTTLELGGKTGFVVFADADLERAADALVYSAFNNAGQTCTAGSRLLVEASVAVVMAEMIASRLRRIRIGDPLDPETLVGPAISARHRDKVRRYIAEAAGTGLKRLDTGPWSLPAEGYYLEPTVFLDVDPKLAIAQEEVFGPVVTVSPFVGDDEAIAIANGTSYGLATTVWTNSLQRAGTVAREARSGLVWVNTVHSLHPGSPYGGYKQSGLGVEMGEEAIQQHMKVKSVWMDDGSWRSPWT
ncbi:MAG: aldehyde dehydrogenase family protein [Roseiarcus sp.]